MDQVSEIRNKIDIVALIQEFVPLKKMGRNFKANCPFHGEKTPSFVVSPERQIWHCFGCNKGGDVYTFLMEYEHMEFPEALRILADRAGVRLVNQAFDTGVSSKKETIYKLNRLAAEFYHYLLVKHQLGKIALSYVLERRHIKTQTLNTFLLGFAPQTGNALTTYLVKKKGYKKEDILEAGLATQRGSQLYDFFQGRLMFPLFDHRDNIIGFSGRILEDNEKTSKYINTRDTLAYHKGMTFFGLNSAKQAIKKEQNAILMEGEFDVISSFQEGITNAVAVKGTALTQDQVNLLARFTPMISLCFDTDGAGQEAFKRSLPLLEKKGITASVVVLTKGKDADEEIQKDPVAFRKAVKHATPAYDFLLSQTITKFDAKTAEGKQAIAKTLLPLFADIENEIVKEHYLHELSSAIDASVEVLNKEIDKLRKKEVITSHAATTQVSRPRGELLEEYFTALFVQSDNPKMLFEKTKEFFGSYAWHTLVYEKILIRLQEFVAQKNYDNKQFVAGLPQELLSAFDSCFLLPLPKLDMETLISEAEKISSQLLTTYIKEQITKIGEAIQEKEKKQETDGIAALEEKLSRFTKLLAKKD